MNDKNSLNKPTSSPIENNVDESAAPGTSSDESVCESKTRYAHLRPRFASHSHLDRARRQEMQESCIQLGNADVVCGRGFQPDSFLGNLKMHRLTSNFRTQYDASSKKEKRYWVHRVIREIREAGGRFLQLTSNAGVPPGTASAQVGKPSRDSTFELVDDVTAYKKVSHAFRSKGRTRMLAPTTTTMMPPSSSTVGNDDRKPAARAGVDRPPIAPVPLPSQLVAVSGILNSQKQQQQLQSQQQPHAGSAELSNAGMAVIRPLESSAAGATLHSALASLIASNRPTQLPTQISAMAQLQQLFSMNPGLSALLTTYLSGGTVVSNPTLNQNMVQLQQLFAMNPALSGGTVVSNPTLDQSMAQLQQLFATNPGLSGEAVVSNLTFDENMAHQVFAMNPGLSGGTVLSNPTLNQNMAELQRLFAMNSGLSAVLSNPTLNQNIPQLQQLFSINPALSGGTAVTNPTLDQNMLLSLLVLAQQRLQQEQVQQQQLSPVNSLFSFTAPILFPSSNTVLQDGMSMSIAINQQLQQLLQANRVSTGSASEQSSENQEKINTHSSQS